MLLKRFAELELTGPRRSHGEFARVLQLGTGQERGQAGGRGLLFTRNSITSNHGRRSLIYLLNFYYVNACHFFEAIFFFFMGNHSESTNRTICPIVLKTEVLIIF